MRTRLFRTGAIAALCCLAPILLTAQTIYRCGNSYSQTPCPGAAVITADDRRSAEQKAQTDAAAVQAARQARAMEHERLARERSARAIDADTRAATTGNKGKPAAPRRVATAKKKPEPAYFTASTGQDDKKHKQAPERSGQ